MMKEKKKKKNIIFNANYKYYNILEILPIIINIVNLKSISG